MTDWSENDASLYPGFPERIQFLQEKRIDMLYTFGYTYGITSAGE